MPLFYYQALNAKQEQVAGDLQAASLAQAVAELESQGMAIQSIGTTPLPAETGDNPFADEGAQRRAVDEQTALQQHLATVMERGQHLLPALRAYASELPASRQRRDLDTVLQILERGDAAEAARTLASLPGYWIPLLAAATASRDPARILREFLQESERAGKLQRQWWLTLTYPAIVGALALVVLAVLSVFVIPIFREIFVEFNMHLPGFTVAVLSIADWIASGRFLIVVVGVIAAAWLLRQATRLLPSGVRHWFGDHVGLWWGRATALARFSEFTADLLEAELEPAQALRLAGVATSNPPIRRAADRLAGSLETGHGPSRASSRVLTQTVLHAVRAAAAPAARIRLLREISTSYAERARIRWSWTQGLVEPLAILAIGLIVGATVVALFLPLVSLINGLA